jgi:hypothetical protein
MGEKLIIGPINKGLRNDRKPFAIDNDSFPTLINAYQWRGRVKRKRGTSFINRLQRVIGTTDVTTGNFTYIINPHPLQAGISVFMVGTTVFVDWDINASHNPVTLITNSLLSTATLNRSTGVLTISGGTSNPLTNVIYFPALPVMGLEDFVISTQAFPGNIAFDTTYAYSLSPTMGFPITDISFYKNPPVSSSLPGYVAKTTPTPLWWNGANYQQFWTTNYQGAFWATNGIDIPFTGTTIGMQFKSIIAVTVISGGPPATANLQITSHGLVVGDFVFINEVATTTGINFETGYVITVTDANNVIVEFPNATIATNGTGGIAQYLTNRSNPSVDCIRWYDGTGWVNFMPPLSQGPYVIEDTPQAQYYLVGARLIVPFNDRLLFFGAVIQTSTVGAAQIYLQDCVVYSLNGTPYYTSSFTYQPPDILNTKIDFFPILTPVNQTALPYSFWEDQFGFGGFQPATIDQAITTVSANEDALIVGFNNSIQTRFIYTGDDIFPFQFYIINAELGSASTFSAVNMDEGIITRGPRGFIITSQTSCSRFDLEIPDQVFEIDNTNNGSERFCSQRDFQNEWIYFTYPSDNFSPVFPTQTLQYNYRDQSWAIFNECYTTYGQIREQTGDTWGTLPYLSWDTWNDSWDSGESNLLQPKVIAGNQQGYILSRETDLTSESVSLYIQNIAANIVTSPNHCLNGNDYIVISGVQGTVGTQVNGIVFQVKSIDVNTFSLSPAVTGTYLGGGQITRMYVPQIYSKQFPTSWELGRKTRLGPQQYLFTNSGYSQVTLLIFLSTDDANEYNSGPIVPSIDSVNNGLIYSTVLYTCPESTNLGLSPALVPNMSNAANTNLGQLNAIGFSSGASTSTNSQQQIWHRMNTSLIGDTVQFGFTLSDAQMRDPTLTYQFAEIEFHAAILDLSSAGWLS